MEALVSIIIPVYNLEAYIERCLKSVINQTYQNLEIICVDDGSSDLSAEKIKALAQKDGRIKYFRRENAGVSAARNLGLEKVTGDYVMFVDGDDFLHLQTVEFLEKAAVNYDAEIVFGKIQRCEGYVLDAETELAEKSAHIISAEEAYEKKVAYNITANLFRTDLIGSRKFNTDIAVGEDGVFMLGLIIKAQKTVMVDYNCYYYYFRDDSALNSGYSLKKSTVIDAGAMMCDLIAETNQEELKALMVKGLYSSIFNARILCKGLDCENKVAKKCKTIGNRYVRMLLNAKRIPTKERLAFAISFFVPPVYKLIRMILDPTMAKVYLKK